MLMWYIRIGCSFLFGLIIVFKILLERIDYDSQKMLFGYFILIIFISNLF